MLNKHILEETYDVMTFPFVSVIVPVYNDARRIATCIESLLCQTYPRERYEVVVIDNGSTDTTRNVVQHYDVTLLVEDGIQSSYAARNKGIRHVQADIIAFTDSDCMPVPEWIAEGVQALHDNQADLAGGHVRFVHSRYSTGAEIYDSLTNMQMEQNIRERSVAKTANLFVVASAFERIGLFPDTVKSGGDVTWTSRATAHGLRLVYALKAEVAHPTRHLPELLRKQYRVGQGQSMMKASGQGDAPGPKGTQRSGGSWRKLPIPRSLMPPSPIALRLTLRRRKVKVSLVQFGRVWAAAWMAQVVTTIGRSGAPLPKLPIKSPQRPFANAVQPNKTVASNRYVHLSDIIVELSSVAVATQARDGSFPAGHNGPYHHQETPVRNTAHWLVTLLKAYDITGDSCFREAARNAATYLASPVVRPMGATFFCRTNPTKDFSNGLIGQAWAIEGLLAAASLDEPRYHALAAEVFQLHPFDQNAGLWKIVNVDGSHGPFDPTFNHQLLFAASGAMIDSNPQSIIGGQVRRFLDCVHSHYLRVSPQGRIVHYLPASANWNRIPRRIRPWVQWLREQRVSTYMIGKEIGYHAFNLYAFALLKRCIPDHPFWSDDAFQTALDFVAEDAYIQGLRDNKYGYPYNPSGFEVALALQTFPNHIRTAPHPAHWWVEQQFTRSYDSETGMLSKGTADPLTLTARIYEATRLREIKLLRPG